MKGTIQSIVYQPQSRRYPGDHFVDFIREPLPEAELVEDLGIRGDRKARAGSSRQVNLLSAGWLAQKQAQGYRTAPGAFGEQLILAGLAVEALRPGDILQLGETVELEITQTRTGCERLEAAQGRTGLAGQAIGMLAQVRRGGLVRVGDEVSLRIPS